MWMRRGTVVAREASSSADVQGLPRLRFAAFRGGAEGLMRTILMRSAPMLMARTRRAGDLVACLPAASVEATVRDRPRVIRASSTSYPL